MDSELGHRFSDPWESATRCQWRGEAPSIEPSVDAVGRWRWPDLDGPLPQLFQRAGRLRDLHTCWLEDLIVASVPLTEELQAQVADAQARRAERLRLFKLAAFGLQIDEHYSRTKRQRDRIIFSVLRCGSPSRIQELALAIREGDIDFAAAAIRFSEGPESAQGGRIGPVSPMAAGHPEVASRLEQANEGDLIGPFPLGGEHLLLRLDTRITTRLDDALQQQLIEELYQDWLNRQLDSLASGESIEPLEYLPAP
jgi:hypothetical protein